MQYLPQKSQKPDYFLLGLFIILTILGLLILSSASVIISQTKFNNPYYYLKHQLLFGLSIGFMGFILLYKISYFKLKKLSLIILLINIGLLILVFVPGIGFGYGNAKRWIDIGPFAFQPSEILKLSFIIYLAAWLDKKKPLLKSFWFGYIPFLLINGLVGLLIIAQPDTGTLGVILLSALMMYFIAETRIIYTIFTILLGFSAFFVLIKISPYRFARFLTFLNPEIDPLGISYQINQAILGIASGGLFGLGFGKSLQKYNYLPHPATDSIFAIFSEETGFLGGLILITIFLLIFWRGLIIAKNAPDRFGKFLAVGISSLIIIQAIINIAAISGLMPLTGIPLPFISYGGTALAVFLTSAGLLLNISKYRN